MAKKIFNTLSPAQKAAYKNSLKKKRKSNEDVRSVGPEESKFNRKIGEFLYKNVGVQHSKNYHAAMVTNLNQDWNPFDIFDNNVNLSDIYAVDTLRYRARDLQRNTSFVQRYLSLMKTNIIGPTGIGFKSLASNRRPDGTVELDQPAAKAIEEAWKVWSQRGNCSVDKSVNFKELQMQVIECIARDGEALIRKHKDSSSRFGFKLEVIDPGRLNTYTNSWASKEQKNVFGGIKMDEFRNPIAFLLGDIQSSGDGGNVEEVPADEMIHLFRKDYPTQVRGISWMACVMSDLHQLTTYTEASVIAAKIAATASVFIKSPLEDGLEDENFDYSASTPTHLEPGTIGELAPGESIDFVDPKHPTTTYPAFVSTLLMHIASGLNVSYMALTGDRTKANNASNRIAVVEEQDGYKLVQNMLIDDFIKPVFHEWLGMALTKKAISFGKSSLALKNKDKFAMSHFIPRSFPSPDPHKDGQVLIQKLSTGMISWKQAVTESGGDPEVTIEQIRADKEMFDSMGLMYPGNGTIQPIVETIEVDPSNNPEDK